MGPLNTFEYSMDVCSEEGYRNELWQNNSRLSWYCSEDFDETRLQSAFSEMGLTEETDEGRLSRALQSWMPDYVINSIEPMEKPPYEPVFTGKLGRDRDKISRINFDKGKRVPSAVRRSKSERKSKSSYVQHPDTHLRRAKTNNFNLKRSVTEIKINDKPVSRRNNGRLVRSSSDDSISTHYSSLFELSSLEAKSDISSGSSRQRRRVKSKRDNKDQKPQQPSRWVELASKKSMGAFDKFMRGQNVLQIETFATYSGEFESEAFEMMDPDERRMVFNAAKRTGIRLNKQLKKSGSITNINEKVDLPKKEKKLRTLSAGHKPLSRGINLEEIKQKMEKERLAAARAKQESRSGRRKRSRMASSSARSEVSSNVSGVHTPSLRSLSPSTVQDSRQETVWKGDKEILEMDLRRGLTTRVKKRIQTTTTALERVTGYGENNKFHPRVGRCQDFPHLIDDDYGFKPKIVQRMRISPFLSSVIRQDIKVRMGRPRYHEISVKDLEWWNRGQKLNRAHRNLKVFNWLHSLREDEFEHLLDVDILDIPPESRDNVIEMHVEAADEPDLKPLYMTDFFK